MPLASLSRRGAPAAALVALSIGLAACSSSGSARRLYAKAGYTPDGSTRVEPEYEATEVRLVKVFS